jgi:hypothetical protein
MVMTDAITLARKNIPRSIALRNAKAKPTGKK